MFRVKETTGLATHGSSQQNQGSISLQCKESALFFSFSTQRSGIPPGKMAGKTDPIPRTLPGRFHLHGQICHSGIGVSK